MGDDNGGEPYLHEFLTNSWLFRYSRMPNLDIIFYTIWDSFHNTIMLYTFGLENFFRRKLILTGIILRRSLLDLKYLELILLCLAVSVFCCCSDHRLSDSFMHSFVNPDADHDAGPAVQGYLLCCECGAVQGYLLCL